MDELNDSRKMDVEGGMAAKWKSMLDLGSEMMESPGAYVVRFSDEGCRVLVESSVKKCAPDSDLTAGALCCCEKVAATRKRLVVSNCAKETEWEHISSKITAFMGYPIFWPANEIYGVVCVADNQEKRYWNWSQQLLDQYAMIIRDDIDAMIDRQRLRYEMDFRAYDEEVLRRSEDQFQKVFRSSPAAIVITALEDGRIIDANESYLRLFGYTREELIGKTGIQMSLFDDPEIRQSMIKRLDNSESVRDYEMTLYTKTGEPRQVLLSLDKSEFDVEPCLISTVYDLTSIMMLKQNLREMNERFSLATRAADMGIWDWDIVSDSLVWDQQMCKLYGTKDCSGNYQGWLDFVHPVDRARADSVMKKSLRGEQDYEDEFGIVRPDGEIRYIKAIGNTVRDDEGRAVRMTGVNFDMTTAKETQAKMQESEARYRSLFHNNNAVQIIADADTGEIIDANAAACTFYGWTNHSFTDYKIWDIDTSDKDVIQKRISLAFERGTDFISTMHGLSDGQQRDVEIFCGRVDFGGRKLIHMIVNDVTERKRTERGLIESENRFRLFVESAPDGVFVEIDGVFVYVNQMTVSLLGASSEHELLGKPVSSFFCKASKKQMETYIHALNVNKKPLSMIKETLMRLDNRLVEVEVSAAPFELGGEDGAIVFLHDITLRMKLEREKLNIEAQLRQKQKLESIGVLAGGVAHEINNPVSGIINYAQLITEAPGIGEDVAEYAGEIVKEGARIADIVKNLLKFARQEKQTHSLAQVNDIIYETLSLIRTIIRKDKIALEVSLADDLPSVKCRSQQIQQVLMNLITNARDALNSRYKEENEDKKIRLSSTLLEREDGTKWARVVVEDHGMGIPDDVKDKMFDPFFTTKSRDKGTGLGLSISHGIVQDHHGVLYFETELGRFTRAVLELPVNNGWALTAGAEG